MAKFKVITVNKATNYKEIELEKINKLLEEGWVIHDKFPTVSNSVSNFINLTFTLVK